MGLTSAGRPDRVRRIQRSNRTGELGLTLTELLVAMVILAVIGGAIGGAFAIGLRTMAPGGAQARITGSHDLLAFEQQVAADVARADCLAAPGQTSVPTAGCSSSVQKNPSTCGSSYLLCIAWYAPGSSTCHTVVYWQRSDGTIERSDLGNGTDEHLTAGAVLVSASWTPTATTNNGYLWTRQVSVTATQQGAAGAPTINPSAATFQLQPLAVDPLSPVLPHGAQAC